MQISKKAAVLFGILGLVAGTAGAIALQTHAAGNPQAAAGQPFGIFKRLSPLAAAGTVTAVNGNTITVTDKRTNTSYTVDAGTATIQKFAPPASGQKPAPATITVSQIQVNDNVVVQGTVSGNTILASKIFDGLNDFGGKFMGRSGARGATGTVSAISGNTITLKGKNGTTYTINAGSATVKKVSDSSVSNIAVGDTLTVNGSVSGNSITAANILDGMPGK